MKTMINSFVVVLSALLLSCAVSAEKPSPPGTSAYVKGPVTLKSLRSDGFVVWGRSNTNTDTRHWLTLKKGDDIYVCDRTVAQAGSNSCNKLGWKNEPNPISLLKSGFVFAGQTVQLGTNNQGRSAITLHFESLKKNKYVYCDFKTANGGQTRCLTKRLQ